jgi:hypothetical protein
MAKRRWLFRSLQLFMLAMIGLSFFIAALAQPVYHSTELGWESLAVLLASTLGFWLAGRQADRRGG